MSKNIIKVLLVVLLFFSFIGFAEAKNKEKSLETYLCTLDIHYKSDIGSSSVVVQDFYSEEEAYEHMYRIIEQEKSESDFSYYDNLDCLLVN